MSDPILVRQAADVWTIEVDGVVVKTLQAPGGVVSDVWLTSQWVDDKSLEDLWKPAAEAAELERDIRFARAKRFAEFEARTVELLAQGFTYDGRTFSLLLEARSEAAGLYLAKDEPETTYPVRVNTLDELEAIDLGDSEQVKKFYLTMASAHRAHRDGETRLKDAVRAATSLGDVSAVLDER